MEPSLTFCRASYKGFWFFFFRYCIAKQRKFSRRITLSDVRAEKEKRKSDLSKEMEEAFSGKRDGNDDGADGGHHPSRCEFQCRTFPFSTTTHFSLLHKDESPMAKMEATTTSLVWRLLDCDYTSFSSRKRSTIFNYYSR